MTSIKMTDFDVESIEGGKGGEGGGGSASISNAIFVGEVFPQLPDGAFAAVCSKAGDPKDGGWKALRADVEVNGLPSNRNNYINCSSFYPGKDGSFKVRKGQFAACHFLMLDDLGTKVKLERLGDFQLSWMIETSPGNYQGGIILAEPIVDGDVAIRLLNALIDAGLCDKGASGPLTRWARLPVAINGKAKYANESGDPFECRLAEWHPHKRYSLEEVIEQLQLELPPAGRPKKVTGSAAAQMPRQSEALDEVLTPKASENPVVSSLKLRGLYKTPLGSGKHDITCPWVHEHTDSLDTGSAYFEPDEQYPLGGYCCQHSHRDKYHIRDLLKYLGVNGIEARHKAHIRVVAGDLFRVIDAAEKELAARGRHYQCGGLVVSVSTDPVTGDPLVIPTSLPALTKELSTAVNWERFDARSNDWSRCDPPARHVSILFDSQNFKHLSPLAGVVRQPYFRESNGELVTQPGYDPISQLFGVFDARQFHLPEANRGSAKVALELLEDLLAEFHFVSNADKAATLSAIFTAVVRPTLNYAPAYHVRAPIFGSGKTYLCELIGTFAGPGGNAKVSYPTTSEEATKVILSLLLSSPAVIEFDDMDSDWIPHGTIKRMLTADKITDRILGATKTATVSTRTLFLGSGNNVGPVRDLLRRVLTINVDPRCAVPATLTYRGYPVDKVRQDRGRYVAAVLTIIMAWRNAGSPRADVENIVTFGGSWSDYCRHPLIWMGYDDPATALLDQVKHDPDGDALDGLMREWSRAFGSAPITIRKAVTESGLSHPELIDAICEFPVTERGGINRSKLGWLLKKYAGRVVNGRKFQQSSADGRVAWRVVDAN